MKKRKPSIDEVDGKKVTRPLRRKLKDDPVEDGHSGQTLDIPGECADDSSDKRVPRPMLKRSRSL